MNMSVFNMLKYVNTVQESAKYFLGNERSSIFAGYLKQKLTQKT